MTKNVNKVNVTIFGQDYPIACPSGEEDGLRKSAIRVDEEMRRIRNASKVMGTDRIAVIVALNLAHEILRNEQQGLITKVAGATVASTADNAGADDTAVANTANDARVGDAAVHDKNQLRMNKIRHDIDAALQLYKSD